MSSRFWFTVLVEDTSSTIFSGSQILCSCPQPNPFRESTATNHDKKICWCSPSLLHMLLCIFPLSTAHSKLIWSQVVCDFFKLYASSRKMPSMIQVDHLFNTKTSSKLYDSFYIHTHMCSSCVFMCHLTLTHDTMVNPSKFIVQTQRILPSYQIAHWFQSQTVESVFALSPPWAWGAILRIIINQDMWSLWLLPKITLPNFSYHHYCNFIL